MRLIRPYNAVTWLICLSKVLSAGYCLDKESFWLILALPHDLNEIDIAPDISGYIKHRPLNLYGTVRHVTTKHLSSFPPSSSIVVVFYLRYKSSQDSHAEHLFIPGDNSRLRWRRKRMPGPTYTCMPHLTRPFDAAHLRSLADTPDNPFDAVDPHVTFACLDVSHGLHFDSCPCLHAALVLASFGSVDDAWNCFKSGPLWNDHLNKSWQDISPISQLASSGVRQQGLIALLHA
ncbi:hypothetical protein C8R44DRAFT_860680 [Mycena epipterygia]|nr:hypothetical protein C8R44DRAFT_860680 [Mycena epipterygia]